MKKVPLFLGIAAIILSAIAIYFAKSSSELVYVDVNKLIEGYTRTKIEKQVLEKKSALMKTKLDTLIKSWESELQMYEKERRSMTAKELELKKQLLSTKQEQLNNYQDGLKNELMKEQQKVTQTVINDINEFIKEYGKEKGYKIILGASGGGNIMYADESTDLTLEVLEGLNRQYGKK